MASKMEQWELGDYCKHFHQEAAKSDDPTFRSKFEKLTEVLSLLDSEFMVEKAACGQDLGGLVETLQSITGKLGYCETERGFEETCGALYANVDAAIDQARSLNQSCFR